MTVTSMSETSTSGETTCLHHHHHQALPCTTYETPSVLFSYADSTTQMPMESSNVFVIARVTVAVLINAIIVIVAIVLIVIWRL